MKIDLELYDKNWAVFDGFYPHTVKAQGVPRVGEIVDAGDGFLSRWGEPSTFIVIDVLWENRDGKLHPVLKCHRWLDGDRQLELEENGWTHGYST